QAVDRRHVPGRVHPRDLPEGRGLRLAQRRPGGEPAVGERRFDRLEPRDPFGVLPGVVFEHLAAVEEGERLHPGSVAAGARCIVRAVWEGWCASSSTSTPPRSRSSSVLLRGGGVRKRPWSAERW